MTKWSHGLGTKTTSMPRSWAKMRGPLCRLAPFTIASVAYCLEMPRSIILPLAWALGRNAQATILTSM
jgi:hypothetical protein